MRENLSKKSKAFKQLFVGAFVKIVDQTHLSFPSHGPFKQLGKHRGIHSSKVRAVPTFLNKKHQHCLF